MEHKEHREEEKPVPFRRSGSRKEAITVIRLKKAKEKGHWPEYWKILHKKK